MFAVFAAGGERRSRIPAPSRATTTIGHPYLCVPCVGCGMGLRCGIGVCYVQFHVAQVALLIVQYGQPSSKGRAPKLPSTTSSNREDHQRPFFRRALLNVPPHSPASILQSILLPQSNPNFNHREKTAIRVDIYFVPAAAPEVPFVVVEGPRVKSFHSFPRNPGAGLCSEKLARAADARSLPVSRFAW